MSNTESNNMITITYNNDNNFVYIEDSVLIDFKLNCVENKKKLIKLIKNDKTLNFVNFPKNLRHEIYKMSGSYPLKFKKNLIDEYQVNILVSHYDNKIDEDHNISEYDSETESESTKSESNYSESESESESESDKESEFNNEQKIINNQELILNEIKNTNKLIKIFGTITVVFISSILYLDPIRLIVTSNGIKI